MGDFVHLHLHTEYSLLDGAARISKIADKAIEEGHDAVAITDHGVMYGAVEFYNSLKKKGVKPIIGCEVYVAPRGMHLKEGKQDSSGNHLILLCKNKIGYRNLCYMVSRSFIDGFYSRPRIDMALLRAHSEGLVALSACIAGKIPQLILSGSMAEAEAAAEELKEIFGEDFYLEVQNHGMDDERKAAYGIKKISEKLGIPMVATNDVHYLERTDADMQATLMCIQTGNTVAEGRPFGFETDDYYYKSTSEMRVLFGGFEGAIENTVKIAEKCNFDFEFDKLHLPDFTSPDGKSHKETLRANAYCGFENKIRESRITFGKNNKEVYTERIEYELSVIDTMGFNAYFLIVSDFVSYAKSHDIPVGPGRGSGAGSLVAFLIGITDVDPLEFDLLFERFLNPERVSMPDFDIDFCYNRREEVIEYVKEKYGEDKVAQIVTFGTLAARAAVRDVGRALDMPYSRVDTVAKLISRECSSIKDALATSELKKLYREDEEVRHLLDVSMQLEGMPRHASTHAAGVVITEKPTYEYVPLSYSGTGVVTQFDMNTDAALGLVKFDFLGLRYLTVIHDAVSSIRKRIPDFDLNKIPLDDEKTFRLLCNAQTDGVFQLESGGMKQVLSKLSPTCLEDIIACVALFRPGPMDSIDTFISRKHGEAAIEYKIPALASILDVTYGCIVYQEQVMQICRLLAGYSYAKADNVRRAMSKKKTEAMQAEREDFVRGCVANGVSAEDAEAVFEDMVGFAKYAFNKSHATAYGIISYRTAYLKTHYPAEYFSALLTSVLDSPAKVKEYIADAQKFGVSVLSPDINVSREAFTVVDGNIRFGLLAIKNVGRTFVASLLSERNKSIFKSFDEFVSRMIGSEINKRTVESMIKCGVFDSLGITRSSLMSCYEGIIDSEHDRSRNNISGQMDLFSLGSAGGSSCGYSYPNLPEFPMRELLLLEKESSGMYFSGHMIDDYSKHIAELEPDSISEIIQSLSDEGAENPDGKYKDRSSVTVAGLVSGKRTKLTKSGDTMAFLRLEDRYSEIEVIVFAKNYKQFASILSDDLAICVKGTVSTEEGEDPKILLSSAELLISNSDHDSRAAEAALASRRLYIKVPSLEDKRIQVLSRIAMLNRGKTQVVLFDASTKKYSAMRGASVDATDKLIEKLGEMFSPENVVLK
ncbi:MAG: DNA polymerase III subunit alpha [Clostridia bacterium]|nr:DNA polymerase III subunit alpha [Clostridia bacterium]